MEVCMQKGCEARASWAVQICVPARGWDLGKHEPFKMIIGLLVCPIHKEEIKIETFLTDQLKTVVKTVLKGKCPPDFKRAYVKMLPLENEEVQMLLKHRSKHNNETSAKPLH